MPRPTKSQSEKKVRVNITLDKSVYKNLKSKNVKISSVLNQLLKVAYFNESTLIEKSNPRRVKAPDGI